MQQDAMLTSVSVESRPGCIQSALSILGDKWSPLLLGLLIDGAKSFSELEVALTGISPRTLSARLDKLLLSGIITKVLYCEHPPRYHYQLTKKGNELQDILKEMADWGAKYHD